MRPQHQKPTGTLAPLAVVRVREGLPRRVPPTNLPVTVWDRIFSVVLSRPPEDGERDTAEALVAAATDPETGQTIPAAGSEHPEYPGWTARPPWVYAVGLREKEGGAILANRSCFYNVRVKYEKAVIGNR